jgi:hypothetical protein
VYDDRSLVEAILNLGSRWRSLLSGAASHLRTRPAPQTWSALEYAAHSRDITALHVFGVNQALTEDEPVYPAIEAEALLETTALKYRNEEPAAVVDELDREARQLADSAANSGAASWSRGITIGDERSTVRRLLEHALHDSLHHLDDVERGLNALRS